MQGGLRDLSLLAGIDRGQRIAKGRTCMGTHLDEDDRVLIQGNQINFTERGAIIFRDDGIALSSEKLLGFALALLPALTPSLACLHMSVQYPRASLRIKTT